MTTTSPARTKSRSSNHRLRASDGFTWIICTLYNSPSYGEDPPRTRHALELVLAPVWPVYRAAQRRNLRSHLDVGDPIRYEDDVDGTRSVDAVGDMRVAA